MSSSEAHLNSDYLHGPQGDASLHQRGPDAIDRVSYRPSDQVASGLREPVLLMAPDGSIMQAWRIALDREGFLVHCEPSLIRRVVRARESGITLMVIDLAESDGSGLQVIRALRDEGNPATILAVTATGDVATAVESIELGADACTDHTCTPRELVARVRALAHRRRPVALRHQVSWAVGDLRVDPVTRDVTRAGERLVLAPREFAVLAALIRRRGRVVSYGQLLHDVWHDRHGCTEHTVEALICGLRKKLERGRERPSYIRTVRRAGYMVA